MTFAVLTVLHPAYGVTAPSHMGGPQDQRKLLGGAFAPGGGPPKFTTPPPRIQKHRPRAQNAERSRTRTQQTQNAAERMDPEHNKTQMQGTQNAAGCRIQCNEERSGTQGPERDRMLNTQKACSTPYRRCTLTHSRNEVRTAFGVSKWAPPPNLSGFGAVLDGFGTGW